MPRYRKKPVVIDAVQFRTADVSTQTHVNFGVPEGDERESFLAGKYWIRTLEGPLVVRDGDWIITGVKGEHYPVKPDIFEATYESADEVVGASER